MRQFSTWRKIRRLRPNIHPQHVTAFVPSISQRCLNFFKGQTQPPAFNTQMVNDNRYLIQNTELLYLKMLAQWFDMCT